ncbi:MAG: 6-phosphogluconolactonase [Polyangiaceae bacterium]
MTTSQPDDVIVAADAAEAATLAAEILGRAIHEAVQERGVARVALSGGNTPSPAYRALAGLDLRWEQVRWYWVDERAGGRDGARNNAHAALEALGTVASRGVVHRMEADAPELEAAAARYQDVLRREFGVAAAVAFDALVLGIGDDGHTASLFPGTGAVRIDDRLVAAIPAQPARELEARLTLTAPVLCEARLVVVMAVGEGKRRPVADARAGGDEDVVPARVLAGQKNRLVWVLDRAAAG